MPKELIEYITRALVDNPDGVLVTETPSEQAAVIELKVAKEDLETGLNPSLTSGSARETMTDIE